MKPWQVILIIFIYDITKSLCIKFLNWKNESSSSSTTPETDVPDSAVDISDKATNEDVMQQESTTKNDLEVYSDFIEKVLKAYKEEGVFDVPQEFLYPIQSPVPITLDAPTCKECKWWKDSDSKYRRGCEAESKCPINNDIVYRGEGYCYMFSPKEDCNKEIE